MFHFKCLENNTFGEDFHLISDSQDVAEIKKYLGRSPLRDNFESFFVKVNDGDYQEIWGMFGVIPYIGKKVYRVL